MDKFENLGFSGGADGRLRYNLYSVILKRHYKNGKQ